MESYIRKQYYTPLHDSLSKQPNLMQVVVGPRQVGKTTLSLQIRDSWKGYSHYDTADRPDTPSVNWIEKQWNKTRSNLREGSDALLILDEVQKVPKWTGKVKYLFDEDRREGRNIRVLLLGSSALLMQRGLTESLAGRFELHRHRPWSLRECGDYFGLTLEEYIFFGGYPVGIQFKDDENRWRRYIRDSLVETVLSKDLLLMAPVRKPALLRQTFGMSVMHPAEIVSYQKMLGTLQDAGNTTTIASYLKLLSQAFLVSTIERWSGSRIQRRGSQPKIIVLDNGILSAMNDRSFSQCIDNKDVYGRMVENAVGAQLLYIAEDHGGELFYWRERNREVDFVLSAREKLYAIEVKSGASESADAHLRAFCKKYKDAVPVVISNSDSRNGSEIPLAEFLADPEKILS